MESMELLYQLASIVESSEDAIISKKLDGIVLSWNKSAERVYGYSAKEMIGKSIDKIYPSDKKNELAEILNKIANDERIENYETVRIRKDGELINVSVTMSPVKNESGIITGVSAIERDITQKKFIERERILREKLLTEAQKIAHLGYWELDLATGVMQWSEELYNIFGQKNESFNLNIDSYYHSIHHDDKDEIKNIIEKAILEKNSFEMNYRIVLPKGNIKIIYSKGEVILDKTGAPVKLRAIAQDITNIRQSERRLAVQFEITKIIAEASKLADSIPQIIQTICEGLDWQIGELWLIDKETNLLEIEGSWSVKFFDAAEFIEVSKKCKFGKGVSLQGRVWENGTPIWTSNMIEDQFFPRTALASKLGLHSALAFPILNNEKIIGVLAFYKMDTSEPDSELFKMLEALSRQIGDFIEKKKSEPLLKESENLYQTLVETSPDAITYTDLSGKILFCNQQAAELFGFRFTEDFIEQNFYAFIAKEDQQHAVENEHDIIVNKKTKDVEYSLIKKDGTKFPAEINTSIVFNADGKPKAFIEVIRDITKRRQAELELKARIKQQSIIAEIDRYALDGKDIQLLMNEVTEIVAHTLDSELCYIAELNGQNEKFFIRAGFGWENGIVGKTYLNAGADTHAGFTLLTQHPVIFENLKNEQRFMENKLLIDHLVFSGACVLIKGRKTNYGVIGVYSKKKKIFLDADILFIQSIANTLAAAIERKKVEEELEEFLTRLRKTGNEFDS
jgi:PAS domain S-box-containing protein